MNRRETGEWPLVVFTVGLQLAAGIAVMIAAERLLAVARPPIHLISISIFPILLVAITGSLFHVGRPFHSWCALSNVRESRLTAELLMCILFAGCAFAQSMRCWVRGSCPAALEVCSGIAALLAVLSSSRLYTIPSQPLWDSGWTHASFIGSMLLLGGVATSSVEHNVRGDASWLVRSLAGDGAILVVAATLASVRSIVALRKQCYTEPEAPPIFGRRHMIGISTALSGSILVAWYSIAPSAQSTVRTVVALLLALVAVGCSRAIMYSRGLELSRF